MKQSKENKTCKERQDDQNWMDITDKVQIGHFFGNHGSRQHIWVGECLVATQSHYVRLIRIFKILDCIK